MTNINESTDFVILYNDCKYIAEKMLIYDSSNNYIVNFSDGYLKKAIEDNQKIVVSKPFETLNEPIFFIHYKWCYNYQHNYLEALPNVYYYIELKKTIKDLYITCPGNLKDVYADVFKMLNLDINYIKVIETNYNFKKLYISKFKPNWFSDDNKSLFISNVIRDNLSEKNKDKINKNCDKCIYVNRRNDLAGKNRFIVNNDNVIDCVKNTFEIITFEDMTIEQKFLSTLNSKIVISPIGANLVNFYFSNNDAIKLFILLVPHSDKSPKYKGFYDCNLKLLISLGKINPTIIKTLYCEVTHNNLSHDEVNNPYTVNIDELDKIIKEFEP